MNYVEETQNNKHIIIFDISELSSDISEEKYEASTEVYKYSSIPEKEEEYFMEEYPSNTIDKKRPRFFSENIKMIRKPYTKLSLNELKIKNINKKLKNIVKEELVNSNSTKFTC